MTEKTKILIVEDERLVALAIETVLTRTGYRVPATASSADEAVRKTEETAPDLVLMDIRLRGEGDGVDAACRIRSFSSVPIVYLTANTEEKTLERARNTGPKGFITKPFEEKTLLSAVENALLKIN